MLLTVGSKKLIRLGGAQQGGHVLEIGCGRGVIDHLIARRLFVHPQHDRFEAAEFTNELESAGLKVIRHKELWAWSHVLRLVNYNDFSG